VRLGAASMDKRQTAVLLLAHGTPETLEDIPAYLHNVTSGRPLPQAAIDEIRHRYSLIGHSPLTELTLEQARLLESEAGLPVYVGMRNWRPYIADVVRGMKADGITEAVAICLAPQNSRTSVGLYRRAVLAEAGGAITVDFTESWPDHPLLAEAFAQRLAPEWQSLCAETGAAVPVLFTAHSVPCRTVQSAAPNGASAGPERGHGSLPSTGPDPYAVEAKRTAAAVARRMGAFGLRAEDWFFAFQSQGVSGGPWIGPSVEDTLTALRQGGCTAVMIQPIGFLCDHVEILYDIDIGFREFGARMGLQVCRPPSLNDAPLLTAALADLVQAGLGRLRARDTGALAGVASGAAPESTA
jgi:ferrochelatase